MNLKKEIEDEMKRIEGNFPDIDSFESTRYVCGRYDALKWVLSKLRS